MKEEEEGRGGILCKLSSEKMVSYVILLSFTPSFFEVWKIVHSKALDAIVFICVKWRERDKQNNLWKKKEKGVVSVQNKLF